MTDRGIANEIGPAQIIEINEEKRTLVIGKTNYYSDTVGEHWTNFSICNANSSRCGTSAWDRSLGGSPNSRGVVPVKFFLFHTMANQKCEKWKE